MGRMAEAYHEITSSGSHSSFGGHSHDAPYTERYPFKAGHRGISTSIEAAQKTDKTLTKAEAEVMAELQKGDATASEIFERIALSQNFTRAQINSFYELRKISRRISPRPGQLEKRGKVFEVGKRESATGNNEIVWSVNDPSKPKSIQGDLF